MGRLMALDVGDRRVGVAVSDPLQLFARPLLTIDRQAEVDYVGRVHALCDEFDVERLIVGLPLLPSGDRGEQAEAVAAFVLEIEPELRPSIEMWDESYTTVEAQSRLGASGRGANADKGRVDAVAAAVLLEEYMSANQSDRIQEHGGR